uniref:Uncharacterized protein n=1 Tax=Melanopsichium pennsylvanicum 4 TaxID=1398559 RepID=A0A077R0S5_9BASI|nr:uncharacterized protein BN887_06233 [Melanopsichium pennsylvanicum 4]
MFAGFQPSGSPRKSLESFDELDNFVRINLWRFVPRLTASVVKSPKLEATADYDLTDETDEDSDGDKVGGWGPRMDGSVYV